MEFKKKNLYFILSSIALLIIGGVVEGILEITGQFVTLFSAAALVTLVILRFRPKEFFLSWEKFTMWFIPISAIIVLLSPNSSGGLVGVGGFGGFPDAEGMTMFLGGLFFVISIILIITKSLKLRSAGKSDNQAQQTEQK